MLLVSCVLSWVGALTKVVKLNVRSDQQQYLILIISKPLLSNSSYHYKAPN